jgi:DNA repair protein RadC
MATQNSKKPHYLGHRKRLKEKFKKSPESFEDYEIVELLLGYGLPRKDTKELAKELITKFKNLKGILFASEEDLIETRGISDGLLIFLRLIREIIIRIEKQGLSSKKGIFSPKEVFQYVKTKIGFDEKENFWILLLNTKNKVISLEKISEGTVDHLTIYPRELFEIILKKKAVNIILIHNHPGGDPEPSNEDILFTKRLFKLCKELDINLLDHIIISYDSYLSFKEKNLL